MSDLEHRLASLREKYDRLLKPDVNAALERHVTEFRSHGALDGILKVGAEAPSFSLKDQNGKTVSSDELLARGPLVVSFFRGTWCPYCNEEMTALAAVHPEIRNAGAELVAITPQSAASSKAYWEQNTVPFPILIDDVSVAKEFGVAYMMPLYLREIYEKAFSLDLRGINASKSWELVVPARFVIAGDSSIVDVKADPDYRYRPDPADTIAVLNGLSSAHIL
jgi:peroxiredoxin